LRLKGILVFEAASNGRAATNKDFVLG